MATALLKGVRRGPKGLGGGPNDGFTTGADKVSLNTCKVTASSETSKPGGATGPAAARRPPLTRAARCPWLRITTSLALRAPDHRRHPLPQAWRRPYHLRAERARWQHPLPATSMTNATESRRFAGEPATAPACLRDVCHEPAARWPSRERPELTRAPVPRTAG